TTRSEDRLLVPSFSSPAPRALPPGAFTARATHPFNSYPHDPPQSGNAPVLLTHISPCLPRPGKRPHRAALRDGQPPAAPRGSTAPCASCGVADRVAANGGTKIPPAGPDG